MSQSSTVDQGDAALHTLLIYYKQANKTKKKGVWRFPQPKERIHLNEERKVNYADWNTAHGIPELNNHTALHK